ATQFQVTKRAYRKKLRPRSDVSGIGVAPCVALCRSVRFYRHFQRRRACLVSSRIVQYFRFGSKIGSKTTLLWLFFHSSRVNPLNRSFPLIPQEETGNPPYHAGGFQVTVGNYRRDPCLESPGPGGSPLVLGRRLLGKKMRGPFLLRHITVRIWLVCLPCE